MIKGKIYFRYDEEYIRFSYKKILFMFEELGFVFDDIKLSGYYYISNFIYPGLFYFKDGKKFDVFLEIKFFFDVSGVKNFPFGLCDVNSNLMIFDNRISIKKYLSDGGFYRLLAFKSNNECHYFSKIDFSFFEDYCNDCVKSYSFSSSPLHFYFKSYDNFYKTLNDKIKLWFNNIKSNNYSSIDFQSSYVPRFDDWSSFDLLRYLNVNYNLLEKCSDCDCSCDFLNQLKNIKGLLG